MISREEMALLVSGAMHEAANAIEAVGGRALTRTETEAMGVSFKTAMQIATRSITWKLGSVRNEFGALTGQLA